MFPFPGKCALFTTTNENIIYGTDNSFCDCNEFKELLNHCYYLSDSQEESIQTNFESIRKGLWIVCLHGKVEWYIRWEDSPQTLSYLRPKVCNIIYKKWTELETESTPLLSMIHPSKIGINVDSPSLRLVAGGTAVYRHGRRRPSLDGPNVGLGERSADVARRLEPHQQLLLRRPALARLCRAA